MTQLTVQDVQNLIGIVNEVTIKGAQADVVAGLKVKLMAMIQEAVARQQSPPPPSEPPA